MSAFYSFIDLMEAKRGRKPPRGRMVSKHFLRLAINFGKLRKLDEKISPKYYIKQLPVEEARKKVRLNSLQGRQARALRGQCRKNHRRFAIACESMFW